MTVDKVELWHRLRNDPDFTRDWLPALGDRPTTGGNDRRWGDGAGKGKRRHIINEISFLSGSIVCSCGESVESTDALSLEDAWDIHRGKPRRVVLRVMSRRDRQDIATDAEVSAFLGTIMEAGGSE